MTNFHSYRLAEGDIEITLEVDLSKFTPELAKMVNEFFSGANDRLARADGDVIKAALLMVFPVLFRSFAMDECSGFLPRATLKEKAIIDKFNDALEEIESVLGAMQDIKNLRIIKNHAQIISLVRCLPLVLDKIETEYIEEAEKEIVEMATERQRAINADHDVVEKFWEIYDYLNGSENEPRLNHSRDDELIAVNLNHFIQVASEKKQQIPMLEDLKRHLKTSRRRKFVAIKNVNSIIRDRHNRQLSPVEEVSQKLSETIKCWVFKKPTKGDRDD